MALQEYQKTGGDDGGEINWTYTFDKYLFFCRRKMHASLSCHYANLYPIFHIISNI